MYSRFPERTFKRIDSTTKRKRGVLADPALVRSEVELLAKRLGVSALTDWYTVPFSRVAKEDKSILENQRNLPKLLQTAFPEHDWKPWRFPHIPRGWWASVAHRKQYMKWLEHYLNIDTEKMPQGWVSIDREATFRETGAKLLARKYATLSSFKTLLIEVWPNVDWSQVDWGSSVESQSWKSLDLQRDFLFNLVQRLGDAQKLENFYKLSFSYVYNNEGGGLLALYDGSLLKALQTLYPSHEWLPWKFKHVPRNFWESFGNQKMFLDWCATELNVLSMQDWYNVSAKDVINLGGRTLLIRYYDGSLQAALSKLYAPHVFERWRRSAG
jgi:hypothetical protein